MRQKYTRPTILDIHRPGQALGECVGGESALSSDWCSGGSNVYVGSDIFGGCDAGGNASTLCTAGTRPQDAYCYDGGAPLSG
jgi:hypothetical protein